MRFELSALLLLKCTLRTLNLYVDHEYQLGPKGRERKNPHVTLVLWMASLLVESPEAGQQWAVGLDDGWDSGICVGNKQMKKIRTFHRKSYQNPTPKPHPMALISSIAASMPPKLFSP